MIIRSLVCCLTGVEMVAAVLELLTLREGDVVRD